MAAEPHLSFRDARRDDLSFIVGLIVADHVMATADQPEYPDHPRYLAAFEAIAADPRQRLIVAEFEAAAVGTLQLSFIPGIARLGETRCLVEAVHILPVHRSRGFGGEMMRWAIEEARRNGCGMVQLTSNKQRVDAHRFYERLGFLKSHEGFKYYL